ncbi:hypothetical protein DENSPDRAFT_849963 [Dentipellis sp. KUC8613]|nr:hypothetical protein DENSPDRAFT_849963 [Dentipellis sp. KUC8613]
MTSSSNMKDEQHQKFPEVLALAIRLNDAELIRKDFNAPGNRHVDKYTYSHELEEYIKVHVRSSDYKMRVRFWHDLARRDFHWGYTSITCVESTELRQRTKHKQTLVDYRSGSYLDRRSFGTDASNLNPSMATKLERFLRRTRCSSRAVLQYKAESDTLIVWRWPLDADGGRILPANLATYCQEYTIGMPQCLCSMIGFPGAQSADAIIVKALDGPYMDQYILFVYSVFSNIAHCSSNVIPKKMRIRPWIVKSAVSLSMSTWSTRRNPGRLARRHR